jgi:hypothetical protein
MPATSRLHHLVRAWYDSLPGINSSRENKMVVPQPAAAQTRCESIVFDVKLEALAAVKREPEPAAALTYGSTVPDVKTEALAGVKLEPFAAVKDESLVDVKSEPCKRRKLQSGLVEVQPIKLLVTQRIHVLLWHQQVLRCD